jgi:hypothetical protein
MLTKTKDIILKLFEHFVIYFGAFFFSLALRPNAGHGLLIREVSRSHTTHHSR